MLYALEIPELFGLSVGDTEFARAATALVRMLFCHQRGTDMWK
jgi:hypothetical protein